MKETIVTKQIVVPDFMARDGSIVLEVTRESDYGGAIDPREWGDPLGHMVCWHKRNKFGDEPHDRNVRDENELAGILADVLAQELSLDSDQEANVENFNSPDRIAKAIMKHTKAVILPIYLLEHGGLWMSTDRGHFDMVDPGSWDHGQVGIIYATTKEMKNYIGVQEVTDDVIARAKQILKEEIRTYSMYLQGDVYEYNLKNEETGEDIDSCGNIYAEDLDELKEGMRDALPEEYKYLAEKLHYNES